MAEEDLFAREVDEELRREQLKKLWARFGPYVIGACVAIVAGVGGWRAYQAWEQGRAAAAGTEFRRILDLSDEGAHEAAQNALDELEQQARGGYPVLARFRRAAEMARNGKTEQAVQVLDALAGDARLRSYERAIARIRAAYLLVDTADVSALQARLEPVGMNGLWRHSVREILGMASYRAGDLQAAYTWFRQAVDDTEVPSGVRNRANVMLMLLASKGVSEPSEQDTAADSQ